MYYVLSKCSAQDKLLLLSLSLGESKNYDLVVLEMSSNKARKVINSAMKSLWNFLKIAPSWSTSISKVYFEKKDDFNHKLGSNILRV